MNELPAQESHFEQKYIIPEEVALRVRDFVRAYLELDENGVGKPQLSYPVHSLYLDSDDQHLYWREFSGETNRFQLRIRYYDDKPDNPVHVEIRRHVNDWIIKKRGTVRRDELDAIIDGLIPEPSHVLSRDPRQLCALQEFCTLSSSLCAAPRVHAACLREAYVPVDRSPIRLTMDRLIRFEPELTAHCFTTMKNPVLAWNHSVVLKLRCSDRFPDWFRELVEVFSLN